MFIQPVSMKIPSQQDYERDLKYQLEKLGYCEHRNFDSYKFDAETWNYLGTLTDGQLYKVHNETNSKNRYMIPAYNPQLFLALAGLTDDPAIKEGDWVRSIDESVDYRRGMIYRVDKFDTERGIIKSSTSSPHPYAQKSQRYFRKTTKEELVKHFDGVNEGVKTVSLAEKPLTQIPKYFVVKRDNSPEWEEYIKWLNKTYNVNWGGQTGAWYGFDGADKDFHGTNWFNELNKFANNPQVFNPQVFETAVEFMKLINNQPMKKVTDLTDKQVIHCPTEEEAEAICRLMRELGTWPLSTTVYSTYKHNICYCPSTGTYANLEYYQNECAGYEVFPAKDFLPQSFYNNKSKYMKRILSRADFKRIHAIACNGWKLQLTDKFKDLLFKDEVEIDEEYYKEMRKACTPEQHRLFDEIFGKDVKEIDLRQFIINKDDIRSGGKYAGKGFVLNNAYKWKIVQDGIHPILIPE